MLMNMWVYYGSGAYTNNMNIIHTAYDLGIAITSMVRIQ